MSLIVLRKSGRSTTTEVIIDVHFSCACQNTPKFNQVKGKGKIVRKEWLEKCHADRKRYPWRRFALDKKCMDAPESEQEIEEETETSQVSINNSYESGNCHFTRCVNLNFFTLRQVPAGKRRQHRLNV